MNAEQLLRPPLRRADFRPANAYLCFLSGCGKGRGEKTRYEKYQLGAMVASR